MRLKITTVVIVICRGFCIFAPYMKAIGRDILEMGRNSPRILKALALALTVKARLGKRTSIRRYTVNKVARLAGVSHSTAAKYMRTLADLELVVMEKDGTTLVFRRLSHSNRHRNVPLTYMKSQSFKDAARELQSLLIMVKQFQKEYVRRLIHSAKNPKGLRQFKRAKRSCDRYVGRTPDGRLPGYRENGMSYRFLGQLLGVCSRTAFRIVEYASEHRLLVKHKTPAYSVYMRGVNGYPVEGFTFTTRNNAYKIFANTYSLPVRWMKEFGETEDSCVRSSACTSAHTRIHAYANAPVRPCGSSAVFRGAGMAYNKVVKNEI